MSPADTARLALLDTLHFGVGNHADFEKGMCVMEAASWLANEPWSDTPRCVCPAIGAFLRNWNDSLPDDETRDRLLGPLLPLVIDTADEHTERRGYMALDWLIRVHTPKWLELSPALLPHAVALRELEEIADLAGAVAAGVRVKAAGDAAWDAAWAAARAAAGAAAWDAAGVAAGAAAWDAAGAAAWDAAWDAAGDAAGDAARAAAWDAAGAAAGAAAGVAAWDAAGDAARAAAGAAAWDAARVAARVAAGAAAGVAAGAAAWDAARVAARAVLKPTTAWLQASAQDLVRRMCAL